jgi:hypothetical protein
MFKGPKCLFPSCFPTKILYEIISLLPHICHMNHQACPYWYHYENNIWWRVEIVNVVIVHFSPVFCYSSSVPCSGMSPVHAVHLVWHRKFHIYSMQ